MVKKDYKKIIQIILIIIAILLIFYIINYICAMVQTQKQSTLLGYESNNNLPHIQSSKDNKINEENDIIQNNINMIENKPIEKNERMIQIENLQNENSDIKGWIEIPGTTVNYPVLQGTDNEFYVDHNYEKEKTKSGSIFIDMIYNWSIPSSNMLIYGHNMKNGTMFTSLLNYKSKKYFEEHPNIRFTTNNTDVTYEIISAFESKIYDDSDTASFKYYYFINANNKDEFDNYVANVKRLSIYDTEKTAEYGDELMTLSTCAYHTKNGRFVVVAKKGENL